MPFICIRWIVFIIFKFYNFRKSFYMWVNRMRIFNCSKAFCNLNMFLRRNFLITKKNNILDFGFGSGQNIIHISRLITILTISYKRIKFGNNLFRTTFEMKLICSRVEPTLLKLCWQKKPNNWIWCKNRLTCSSNICYQLTSSIRSRPSWLNL